MDQLKRFSLRHKLIGLVLLSLLPVLLILLSTRQSEHNQAKQVFKTHVQRLSVFIAREPAVAGVVLARAGHRVLVAEDGRQVLDSSEAGGWTASS